MLDTFSRRVSFKNIRSNFAKNYLSFCAIASVPKMTNHRRMNVDSIVSNMKAELNMQRNLDGAVDDRTDKKANDSTILPAAVAGADSHPHQMPSVVAVNPAAAAKVATYESDILFTFTSLTKWTLDMVTDLTVKVKKSSTLRYVRRRRLIVSYSTCALIEVFLQQLASLKLFHPP